MRKCKKILGMLLAFCMVVGMLPMSALAAESLTISSVTLSEDGTLVVNGTNVKTSYFNVYSIDADTKNVAYVIQNDTVSLPTTSGTYDYYIDLSTAGESVYDLTNRGFEFTYKVEAAAEDVLTLSATELTLAVGNLRYLYAYLNNISTDVTWSSDNTKVATVDEDGRVLPRAAGTAVITAAVGELTAKCELTVVNELDSDELSLYVNLVHSSKHVSRTYYTIGGEQPNMAEEYAFRLYAPYGYASGDTYSAIMDALGELTVDASNVDWTKAGNYEVTVSGPSTITVGENTYQVYYSNTWVYVSEKTFVELEADLTDGTLSVAACRADNREEVTIEKLDVYYYNAQGEQILSLTDATLAEVQAKLDETTLNGGHINIGVSSTDETYESAGSATIWLDFADNTIQIRPDSESYYAPNATVESFDYGFYVYGSYLGDDTQETVAAALEKIDIKVNADSLDLTKVGKYVLSVDLPVDTITTAGGKYVLESVHSIVTVTDKTWVKLAVTLDSDLVPTVTVTTSDGAAVEGELRFSAQVSARIPMGGNSYRVFQLMTLGTDITLEQLKAELANLELAAGDYALSIGVSGNDEKYGSYNSSCKFTIDGAGSGGTGDSGTGDTSTSTPSTSTPSTSTPSTSTPSTSTTVTVPVPTPEEPEDGGETGEETGDDVTANVEVEATITGSTADVTVSEEEIVKAITGETGETGEAGGDAPAQEPAGVVIDLSNIPGKEIKSVELPADTLQTVLDTFQTAMEEAGAEKTDAPVLTVKLSSGAIAFDTDALSAVVEQADGQKVQFKVNVDTNKGTSYLSSVQREAVKDKEIFAGVDAYAFNNGGRISDFKGGSVEMSIPFDIPEGYKSGGFSVWYVSEDGELVKHRTTWKNGRFFWTVNHWSDYIIAYDESDISVYPDENGGTAHASTVKVVVDGGEAVDMYAYALKDEEGNSTNYFKLRDIAALLNGTAAQFEVDFDGSVVVENGKPYTAVGDELVRTFDGDHAYTAIDVDTRVDGVVTDIAAFCLHLENGDGYNYYQLRDVGRVLGFNVAWDDDAKVIVIQTGKAYTGIL